MSWCASKHRGSDLLSIVSDMTCWCICNCVYLCVFAHTRSLIFAQVRACVYAFQDLNAILGAQHVAEDQGQRQNRQEQWYLCSIWSVSSGTFV